LIPVSYENIYIQSVTERNSRLADAMARRQLSSSEMAAALHVDPRTVDRWIEDRSRVPHGHSRAAVADLLDVPAGALWPGVATGPQVTDELVALYPTRTSMPLGHVMASFEQAEHNIDVLVLAGLWLWDSVPQFSATLTRKANAGVDVRYCLGDPRGLSARTRGEEEDLGDALGWRCEISVRYAQRALAGFTERVRLHDTTLYASILRFDDDVLVNWHLYGAGAPNSPVLHLRRRDDRGMAQTAMESFERVWQRSYEVTG
jgi:transcriptional regulator with XRE-family HTH domain